MRVAAVLAGVLLLAGCAVTVPVAVISDRDGTLRGSSTATLAEGSFSVTNGRLTCSGTYDPYDSSPQIQVVILCSDGRKGFAVVTRTTATTGHGTVRMSDGSTASILLGAAASSL